MFVYMMKLTHRLCQGLTQPARFLRGNGGYATSKDVNKLRMIDHCSTLLRHITVVSSSITITDLKDKILSGTESSVPQSVDITISLI